MNAAANTCKGSFTMPHVTHKYIPPRFLLHHFHCTLPSSLPFNFMQPIDAIMHLHIIEYYNDRGSFLFNMDVQQ